MNFNIELSGGSFFGRDFKRLWTALEELGLEFHTFSFGNKDRPLGPDPLADITPWAMKKASSNYSLRTSDDSTTVVVDRFHREQSLRVRCQAAPGRGSTEVLAWVKRMLSTWDFLEGHVNQRFSQVDFYFEDGPRTAWLHVLSPAQRERVSAKKLAPLVKKFLPGGEVFESKRNVGFTVSATPGDMPPLAQLKRFGTAWDTLELNEVKRLDKADLSVVREVLEASFAPWNFTATRAPSTRELHLVSGQETVVAEVYLSKYDSERTLSLKARLQGTTPNSYWSFDLGSGPLKTWKRVTTNAATLYGRERERWLKNPKTFKPKK